MSEVKHTLYIPYNYPLEQKKMSFFCLGSLVFEITEAFNFLVWYTSKLRLSTLLAALYVDHHRKTTVKYSEIVV